MTTSGAARGGATPLADPERGPSALDRLLVIEDDPGLLQLTAPETDVLAWPAIRLEVLRLLIGDLVYPSAPFVDLSKRGGLTRLASAAARAAVHGLTHPVRSSPVLIMATGAGLVPRPDGSFNRYTDYFAEALAGRTWSLERLFGDSWPVPPRGNPRLGFLAVDRLELTVRGRLSVRASHRSVARKLVDLVADRARRLLAWEISPDRQTALTAMAARHLAAYPVHARQTERLIRRIRPRVLMLEEACYGSQAVVNATARDLDVLVAEFQHGMVTRGHDAYNVAPGLAASAAYRRTQPAAFLAYGRWWGAQFNAPVGEKVVIGNPHRTETLRSWRPSVDRSSVLVIGDGVETSAYLDLCRNLSAIVPGPFRVVYRPHPVERDRIGDLAEATFAIDRTPELYESLSKAAAVVGEASTVLFEAVGLVPKIFVWDTEKSRFYLGQHPFARFAEPAELAASLLEPHAGNLAPDVAHDIWAEDWRGRFLGWVEQRL